MDINGIAINTIVRVNRRAKRLILKVDPVKKSILLTCPSKRTITDAKSFAAQRHAWIQKQLEASPTVQNFSPNNAFPFKGDSVNIVHTPENRRAAHYAQENRTLLVGGDEEKISRRVTDWLKKQARLEFAQLADLYCTEINVTRRRISIRDTRSRWGSCSSDGAISLNWRLIMAPEFVYTYVVAHEVAHLRHLNHSHAFWETVAEINPHKEAAAKWLKENGTQLHAWGTP